MYQPFRFVAVRTTLIPKLKRLALLACATVVAAGLLSEPSWADERPLAMSGKKSLLQRVLARPGASILTDPVDSERTPSTQAVPFSVFYVYGRERIGGTSWVRVGANSHGDILGWVRRDQLIDWQHSLTVAFRDPIEHDRVLLFRDRESLKDLVDRNDIASYRVLQEEAERGEMPPESPVVAVQPRAQVDIARDFYLVPILQHEDIYLADEQALLLEVATVPAQARAAEAAPTPDAYRSGIVFVTDATISMGPYLERTREAIRTVLDAIESAGLGEAVGFGLVAYRDSTEAVPGLKFRTRIYASPGEGADPRGFLQKVASVQPAAVSSVGFNEDAFAGVKQAIEDIDWTGFDARYVVLITDAGARPGHDRLGATGLDPSELRQLAQDKGIAIWALHLLTPEGADNHAYAEQQYRELSQYPGIGAFYYPVTLGSLEEYGSVLEAISGQIVQQVQNPTTDGEPAQAAPAPAEVSELARFQEKVDKLGYALRMRYLQRREGETVPEVFNAWMVDRDFDDPTRKSLDVRVLLTRDQLSDLQYVLKRVLDAAEEGVLSPATLLDDLKSLAASISRDPQAASASTRATGARGENLADLGYMREYIEGLPYRGDVMNLSLEEWEDWSAKKQLSFIHKLESKINYYQALHDNTDLWISLDGGPVSGDSVFPVSLAQLP